MERTPLTSGVSVSPVPKIGTGGEEQIPLFES
jgi:hypothetical protein